MMLAFSCAVENVRRDSHLGSWIVDSRCHGPIGSRHDGVVSAQVSGAGDSNELTV